MSTSTSPTIDEIAAYVRDLTHGRFSLATRRNVETMVNRYARTFVVSGWTFVGSEVRLPGGRLDLVWRDEEGLHWIDELKTGQNPDQLDHATRTQIDRYLTIGSEEYAEFGGVRLCVLRHPRFSLLARPDGSLARLAVPPEVGDP